MPKVTVYSKPVACVQCVATKRWLEKNAKESDYEIKNALDHMDVIDKIGVREAPVVVTENGSAFGGFQPDKLQQIFAET